MTDTSKTANVKTGDSTFAAHRPTYCFIEM